MDVGTGTSVVWGVVMIAVLLSSLAARRLPLGRTVRMALAWVAVFAGLYGLLLFRDDFAEVWRRARADVVGAEPTVSGSTTILRRAADGHFWADASIGGRTHRFLVDSGATTTAISPETAAALQLDYDRDGRPIVVMTANGLANAWPTTLPPMQIGTIATPPLRVLVLEAEGSENLLGMNWLSQLKRWRVEGNEMTLEP